MRQLLPQLLYIYMEKKRYRKFQLVQNLKKKEEKKIIQPNVFQYEKKGKM